MKFGLIFIVLLFGAGIIQIIYVNKIKEVKK